MFGRNERQRAVLQDLEARVGALEGILDGIQRRLETVRDLMSMVKDSQSHALETRKRADNALSMLDGVGAIADTVDDLKAAVAHGIEHVERTEARIRATVQRARKEFREGDYQHPGVEAEAEQLRLLDGGRSEGGELPPVREGVAGPEESHQEAWTARLRAMGLSA